MKLILKYLWSICLSFILFILVKILYYLVIGEVIDFKLPDFVGFLIGAVVITFFLKDSVQSS